MVSTAAGCRSRATQKHGELAVAVGTTSMRLNESATCVCSQASYSEDQLAGKWRPTVLTGGETERGTRLRANERSSEGAEPDGPRRALLPGLLIQVKRILAFLDASRRARARARPPIEDCLLWFGI